jgi:hypothetical protein
MEITAREHGLDENGIDGEGKCGVGWMRLRWRDADWIMDGQFESTWWLNSKAATQGRKARARACLFFLISFFFSSAFFFSVVGMCDAARGEQLRAFEFQFDKGTVEAAAMGARLGQREEGDAT